MLWMLACGGSPTPPVAPAPSAPDEVAQAPAPAPPLTAFRGTAHDGSPRSASHLSAGHPTVVWFYPKAATGG
jgi:hypothetical protein